MTHRTVKGFFFQILTSPAAIIVALYYISSLRILSLKNSCREIISFFVYLGRFPPFMWCPKMWGVIQTDNHPYAEINASLLQFVETNCIFPMIINWGLSMGHPLPSFTVQTQMCSAKKPPTYMKWFIQRVLVRFWTSSQYRNSVRKGYKWSYDLGHYLFLVLSY